MADYNRDRSGGGGRGGKSFGGGNRNSGNAGFGGGGYGGGRPKFGRGDDRGGRGGYEKPQMYKAVCDDCGAPCELPFRPSGDKPVFCRDCFANNGGPSNAGGGRGRDESFREKRHEAPKAPMVTPCITKEQFEMLNGKLDKILKLITPVITVSKEMQANALEKDEKAAIKENSKSVKKPSSATAKKVKPAAKAVKKVKNGKKSA